MTLDETFGLADGDERWLEHLRGARATLRPTGSLGRFEVLDEVGRGAQGVVYRAHDPERGAVVALKRLSAGALASDSARLRFRREIEATAALAHPGVVAVYGVDEVGGELLLSMEWVDGVPFSEWAAGRPAREVLRAFAELCGAVRHAHQRGVLHRDLKPSNVLVDADGRPRVLDFGLAKLDHDDAGVTRTGAFVGTPAYASPEQIEEGAGAVDARSDLWALGVVLFEALAGHRPFDPKAAGGALAILRAARAGPPPLFPRRADLRREIDVLVRKALAPAPDERYATVDALAEDVRRYLAGEPLLAHPPSALYQLGKLARANRSATALAGALVVLLPAFGAYAETQATVMEAERGNARAAEDEARRHAESALAARDAAERERERALAAARDEERARAEAEAARERAQESLSEAGVARELALEQRATLEDVITLFLEAVPHGVISYARGKGLEGDGALDELASRVSAAYADDPLRHARALHQVARLHRREGRVGDWASASHERARLLRAAAPDSAELFDALREHADALEAAAAPPPEREGVLLDALRIGTALEGAGELDPARVHATLLGLAEVEEARGGGSGGWRLEAQRFAEERGLPDPNAARDADPEAPR